jgi:hypothetical protein
MADSKTAENVLSSAGSSLEKITDIKYFHLVCILFFLLDNYLVVFLEKNVTNFEYADIEKQPLSHIIIFIFLTSFMLSFFFPLVRLFIKYGIVVKGFVVYLHARQRIDDILYRWFGQGWLCLKSQN